MFGPLLEVDMLKKCTGLWREAHFEVKSVKARQAEIKTGSPRKTSIDKDNPVNPKYAVR